MQRKNTIIVILCILVMVLGGISVTLAIKTLIGTSYTRCEEADGTEYLLTRDGVKIADPILYSHMSMDGWKTAVYIENSTSKDIKYITTISKVYNRVGDPAPLDYEYSNEIKSTNIGPIKRNEKYYFPSYEFESSTMEYIMLEKVIVTYMDDTSEEISGINIKHRYSDTMYGKDADYPKKYDAYFY